MRAVRSIISSVKEGAIKLFSGGGRAAESFADREYFQHYGFTSRPLAGGEAILLKEGNVVYVVASDDRRHRISIEDGEVALYTDEGDKVHLKRGREIEITGGEKVTVSTKVALVTATTSAKVDSPTTEVTGDLMVGGNLVVAGTGAVTGSLSSGTSVSDSAGSMQGMRDTYNGHTHPGGGTPNPQM